MSDSNGTPGKGMIAGWASCGKSSVLLCEPGIVWAGRAGCCLSLAMRGSAWSPEGRDSGLWCGRGRAEGGRNVQEPWKWMFPFLQASLGMAQLLTPVGLLFVLGGGGEPGEANLAMTAACNPARQISFSDYGFLIALGALHLQRVPSTFKLASRVKGRVFVEKPCVAGISVRVCSGAPVWAQHTMPASFPVPAPGCLSCLV